MRAFWKSAINILVLILIAHWAEAANKPQSSTSSMEAQELLQLEVTTKNSAFDRREALKPSVRPESADDAVWWLAGYLRSGKNWKRLEDSTVQGDEVRRLRDYSEHRTGLLPRPHGQVELANWCRKNGFLDQERVHLLQALSRQDSTINFDAACQRLGCKNVNGTWVSPQERREADEITAEIERSHKQWSTRFRSITELLDGSPKQRTLAESQMAEITQGSAVPALLSAFCLSNQSSAELGVRTLGQIPDYQASRALAGQAVFSPWRSVRVKAIELLKERKLEEFVPDLLLLLSKPIRTRLNVSNPIPAEALNQPQAILNVRMNWDYVWIEESRDTIRVGIRRLFPVTVPALMAANQSPAARNDYLSTAILELSEQTSQLNDVANRLNEGRLEMNERVTDVLSKGTGEPSASDPNVWWNWWLVFSNMNPQTSKPVVIVDERIRQPSVATGHSCLVAGTPVWTERGLKSIETILPGDRVLSKDISSGELTYKPVLVSTVREPTPVQQFSVGEETIVASPGHHFWVSGDGWTKVRKLAPEQPLHTATGMQRILSVDDQGQVEKVYNLVVADFHTYFVGKSMILSHDVLQPRLTNVKVPGLTPK